MVSSYRRFFWFHWFFCFSSIYVFHSFSKIFSFDPFLAERLFSLALVGIVFFLFLWTALVNSISVSKGILMLFVYLFVMVFYSLSINKFGLGPIFFLAYAGLIAVSVSTVQTEKVLVSNSVSYFCFLFLVFHLFAFLSGLEVFFQQGDRFVGLFSSPTTFATWVLTLFVVSLISYDFDKPGKGKFLVAFNFALVFLLVFFSGTRTNLFLVLFLGLYLLIGGLSSRGLRFFSLIMMVALVLLIYPAYSIFTLYVSGDYVAYRFEGGEDTSLGLRVALFNAVFYDLLDSDFLSLLFGHGVESSRYLIERQWGIDILPHNDALRLFYDFGVVFSFCFFGLVSLVAARTHLSFLIGVIYVFSFIHNMIYSHYLISAIFLFAYVKFGSSTNFKYAFQGGAKSVSEN